MPNLKTFENTSLIAIIIIIISLPAYAILKTYGHTDEKSNKLQATYVGGESCKECHLNEFNQWQGSHHDLAMDYANDSTVLGDFNNQTIEYNGMTHKMYKKDDKFYVYTDGEDGKMKEFQIKYTFGFYPLQQYLVEFDKGRLQTLPLTWNSDANKWYHMAKMVYPDQVIDHTNWLHWTNQAQNWNGMCADCHSTNLQKGYSMEDDSYQTTWSEIDVSCEACHGPASEHIKWANQAPYARNENNNFGLTVKTSGIEDKEYVDLCVRCHARRGSFDDFHPNKPVYSQTIPNLPIPEHYYIDGQIHDEDYVFSSFTQSKMYMRGVKCNDCHDVHSTKRYFEDNRLCTQCHRADDYDTYNHHFHKGYGEKGEAIIAADGTKFKVGDGTRCINCHMPAQYFMGVDYRNDHSMRIPRPDLTKTLGTPNACNQCHADKSVDWAINYVNKWHGISRPYQYGIAFKKAVDGDPDGYDDLIRIYNDEVYPEMIRATAINLLGHYYPEKSKTILLEAANSMNDHIRYNAIDAISIDDEASLHFILDKLKDKSKAIRLSCFSKIMSVQEIPDTYKTDYEKIKKEYYETLKYNADFPTGKLALANYYMGNQQSEQAETFLKKAIEQDNELYAAKISLAILYNSTGKINEADQLFQDYLASVPNDGQANFTYALFLSEQKKYDLSLEYMLKATQLSPQNARIKYNIAMMYDFMSDYNNTEKYLKAAISTTPNDVRYYTALLSTYLKHHETNKTKELTRQILKKFPNIPDKEQLENLLK